MPQDERKDEAPLIELGGEGLAPKFPRLRFYPDRFVFVRTLFQSGCDGRPLRAIRHIERVVAGRGGVRTGVTCAGDSRLFEVGVGPLLASDRLDELDGFLAEHAPGHLYSIADEDGIRYSRDWQLAEVVSFMARVTRVAGRGKRTGRRHKIATDVGGWWLERQDERHAIVVQCAVSLPDDPPVADSGATDEEPAGLELFVDTVFHSSGLALGTIRAAESGNVTIALGSGEVLEILAKSGKLLVDGAAIGQCRRKIIRFDAPLPEVFGLLFLIALHERDMQAEQGDGEETRPARFPAYWSVLPIALLLLLPTDDSLLRHPVVFVIAVSFVIIDIALWRKRRRQLRLSGGPTHDLAERRRQRTESRSHAEETGET